MLDSLIEMFFSSPSLMTSKYPFDVFILPIEISPLKD